MGIVNYFARGNGRPAGALTYKYNLSWHDEVNRPGALSSRQGITKRPLHRKIVMMTIFRTLALGVLL